MYACTATAISGSYYVPVQQSLEERQRERLEASLQNTRWDVMRKLDEKFGLADQGAPRNAKELVARIKDGKYIFTQEFLNASTESRLDEVSFGSTWGLRWRDPATVADHDGHAAALYLMETEYQKVKRQVWILPLADALAAVEAFEAKTFA